MVDLPDPGMPISTMFLFSVSFCGSMRVLSLTSGIQSVYGHGIFNDGVIHVIRRAFQRERLAQDDRAQDEHEP